MWDMGGCVCVAEAGLVVEMALAVGRIGIVSDFFFHNSIAWYIALGVYSRQ